jgi:hypothetical protein
MAVGDVYEVVAAQLYGTSTVLNVFFYEQIAIVVPAPPNTIASLLAEQWDEQVGSVIREIQNVDVVWDEIRCRNLFDSSDAGSYVVSDTGTASETEGMGPFVATAFQLFGDNPAVKNGAKRFVGVVESWQADGIVTSAPIIAQGELVAEALATNVTAGDVIPTDTWAPVIVKRVRSGSPGAYEYRLPESVGETVLSRVASALLNVFLSSQVSRKYGRGI